MNIKYKIFGVICKNIICVFLLLLVMILPVGASSYKPIKADNRIKTLLYNENEVYPLVTKTGYQLNIEFNEKEEIIAVSLGDSSAWKITPAGTRLFVKPLVDDVTTNMTVITNKRAYQFDLITPRKGSRASKALYVVRFYYPGEKPKKTKKVVKSEELTLKAQTTQATQGFNFNYTVAGSKALEPKKVFDDGKKTYFEITSTGNPKIFYVNPSNGAEMPLRVYKQGKFFVVDRVGWQFSLRNKGEVTCLFNEKFGR